MTFVNWPGYSDDGEYHSTGEGGLYAYVVWGVPETKCHVDVSPCLAPADVFVSAIGPLSEDFALQSKSYNHPYDRDDDEYSDSYVDDYELQEHRSEVPAITVVFLGSTEGSFYSERLGRYFEVNAAALTDVGASTVTALTQAYGSEPTFITYLDT